MILLKKSKALILITIKHVVLFVVFGLIYYGIEIWARGYSHPAMIAVGGICGVVVGLINEDFDFDMSLLWQMFVGAFCITVIEFVSGLILNVWLGLDIWDYSSKPFNILGIVCFENSIYWYFLSGVAIVLDDVIRWKFFKEDKPHYHWI